MHHDVAELPPYRALMVVDMKNFSGEKGRDHARITEQIPLILQNTFQRCRLDRVWDSVRFQGTTGDGYFAGLDPRYLPFVLHPFLPALQDELEYQNRVAPGHQPLRMRVSVTVGPMTDSGGKTLSDGSGDTRIEAHRMIDDTSVRDLLTRSGSVTCVAAIVSSRVYDDVVASGYSAEDPALYVPVDIEVKTYRGRAYLRVPKPSGDLLTGGFRRTEDVAGCEEAGRRRERIPGESAAGSADVVGVGQAHGRVGNVIAGHGNTVHTGSGHQFNDVQHAGGGPAVFGTNQGGMA